MVASPDSPQLVGAEECIELIFPCEKSRPGLRTFRQWQAQGYIPVHRIGRRTYFDPVQVRAAIERRFRIAPAEVR
ncbi:hypothetical protein [Luteolibacter soli]|uniref:Helix-turn-helix domain-containing protein n=1 Tax=Luteolibacter soli TaxID=3135280 RepID=A0ABU9B2R9_9BACT